MCVGAGFGAIKSYHNSSYNETDPRGRISVLENHLAHGKMNLLSDSDCKKIIEVREYR